jgi:hypothetical protein
MPDPEVRHLLARQRAAAQQLPQRLPLEQLHHDVRAAEVVADVVDRADVGVVERGGDARLALEPLERLGSASRSADRTLTATGRFRRRSSAR